MSFNFDPFDPLMHEYEAARPHEDRVPLCKIARENRGRMPLDCLFECQHGCSDEREGMRLAKPDLTCRSCGAPCRWQEVIAADGNPTPRLFEGGKPHVCNNTADGFESV